MGKYTGLLYVCLIARFTARVNSKDGELNSSPLNCATGTITNP